MAAGICHLSFCLAWAAVAAVKGAWSLILAAGYRQDTWFNPKAYQFAPDPLSSVRSPLYRTFVGVRLHPRERGS